MIELLQNVGTWFVENMEMIKSIASLVAAFIMLAVLVIVLVHKKMISNVNHIVTELSKIVDDYKGVMTELDAMKSIIEKYDVTTNKSIEQMLNVENVDVQMLKKLNSVLDILALAYSTIKNDDIRLGIASIANTAKYIDPHNESMKRMESKKKELQKELQNKVSILDKVLPVKEALKVAPKETPKPTAEKPATKSKSEIRRC